MEKTSAQETSNNTKSTCNTTANDPAKNTNINDADDDDAFTPVGSNRKDRNSRRNKDRGSIAAVVATATGSNNTNNSNRANKSQRQPRSENGRSKDKRAKGNNHRDDKEKSIAQPESVTTGEFYHLFALFLPLLLAYSVWNH